MARFAAALLVALLGAAGAHGALAGTSGCSDATSPFPFPPATAFPFTPCATDADCKEGFGCALGSCVPAGWQAEPEPIVATETVTVAEISRRQDEDEFESAESGPVDIGTPSSEPSEPSQPLDLSAEEPIDEYDLVDEEDPIDAEAHRLAKRQNCDAYCRYALHQAAKQASVGVLRELQGLIWSLTVFYLLCLPSLFTFPLHHYLLFSSFS